MRVTVHLGAEQRGGRRRAPPGTARRTQRPRSQIGQWCSTSRRRVAVGEITSARYPSSDRMSANRCTSLADSVRSASAGEYASCLPVGSRGDDSISASSPKRRLRTELMRSTDSSPCRSGKTAAAARPAASARRAAAARRFGHRSRDQARILESVEVLAQRRVGEPELGGQIGGRRRLDALQPLDDPSLGVGQLCSRREFYPCDAYFGSYALHNQHVGNARNRRGFDKMFRS